MRKVLAPICLFIATISLVGCGAQGEETTDPHAPGQKSKDYSSNTEREFRQPDEFYDFGDYDRVKTFTLQDGTRCVIFHPGDGNNGSGDGGGITCEWQTPSVAPSPYPSATPSE